MPTEKHAGLTLEIDNVHSHYSTWRDINEAVSECVFMHFSRQKIEDLEAERQRLEEQNNILEMRLERHNLQVGTKTPLQLFSVMDLLVWHKGTNLITPRAAALPV